MNLFKHFLAFQIIIASILLTACEDRFNYGDDQIIGDGEAVVEATLEYEPSVTVLGASRSAGNSIQDIKTLAVVVYNPQGKLVKLFNNSDLKFTPGTTSNAPSDLGGDKSDIQTGKATFKIVLPFGRYRMYAVANLGRDLTQAEVDSVSYLKNIECEWNSADITKDAQMFGYFTNLDNQTSSGFEASQPVVINKSNISIHAWIKRLASKVTVAFNGKDLHQGIFVYIHNVSIRQIPLYCRLGVDNCPTNKDSITTDGYGTAENRTSVADLLASKTMARSQVLFYSSKGVVNTDEFPDEKQYENWLRVGKGSGIKGISLSADGDTIPVHNPMSPALFFYENMQGDKEGQGIQFNKAQLEDKVGDNVGPGDEDYRDNVPYGTFIEVEAYYKSENTDNLSEGSIKYRFMLGQNTSYNYNAIRNHHYKVTLGFRGFANQPDWHIEYNETSPEIYVPEVYVPYLYNQSVEFPIRFVGDLQEFDMELIENNWAPFDNNADSVPGSPIGSTNFTNRTIQFAWNRDCYLNAGAYTSACPNPGLNWSTAANLVYNSNYLYGRHLSDHKQLNGDKLGTEPMYVTPIWVGFLRLQQPAAYQDDAVDLPMTLMAESSDMRYDNPTVRAGLKSYYFGEGNSVLYKQDTNTGVALTGAANRIGTFTNNTNLAKRSFGGTSGNSIDADGGIGRNSYKVIKSEIDGETSRTFKVKLWTQPKTLGSISGFSGSNPYESYSRKAVIRLRATFRVQNEEGGGYHYETKYRDVRVLQSPRIINPKGVWRSSSNSAPFKFIMYENNNVADGKFTPLISRGAWTASVSAGSGITLSPLAGSRTGENGNSVEGDTDSPVMFMVNFSGGNSNAVVDVLYHGNNCIHKFYVRQGFDNSEAIITGGAKWSSYSVYSFASNTDFGATGNNRVTATLTVNPLALGSMFKKGNYAQGLSISNNQGITINNSTVYAGPLESVGQNTQLALVNGGTATWLNIPGISYQDRTGTNGTARKPTLNSASTVGYNDIDSKTWEWAKVTVNDKNYRFPTFADFQALLTGADVGVGVLYGDGATEPKDNNKEAFGFFDSTNKVTSSDQGMRGFFVYNGTTANQVFFPIGTSGLGRRTMQGLQGTATTWKNWAGTLRYSSVTGVLSGYGRGSQFRPIPYNMPAVPGVIYWLAKQEGDYPGWEMNFFDLNFNPYDYAMSIGPYGDAVPIKLIEE